MLSNKAIPAGPTSKFCAITFLLFISFSSFTDAFEMGRYLKLPYIFAILSFTFFFLSLLGYRAIIRWKKWVSEDVLILIGVTIVACSALVNPNTRSVYYVLAYFFVFALAYYYVKLVLMNLIGFDQFLTTVLLSAFIVSILVILDFTAYNIFGLDLQALIPRNKEAIATYDGLRRSYGFTTEPTIMALYFNTIGVLAVWYVFFIRRNLYFGFVVGLAWLLAWVSTFSGAGLPLLTLGLLLSGFFILAECGVKGLIKKSWINRGSVLLLCLLVLAFTYAGALVEFFSGVFDKALLGDRSSVRTVRWSQELSLALQSPIFGHGPGYNRAISDANSSLSWYIFLAKEAGFFASAAMFLAWVVVYVKLLASHVNGKYFLAAGVFAGGLHYLAISTFWHPPFWIFLAFVSVSLSTRPRNRILHKYS